MKMHKTKILLTVLSSSLILLTSCDSNESEDEPTDPDIEEPNGDPVEPDEPDDPEEPDDSNGDDEAETEPELSQNLEDWIPKLENVQYVYTGDDGEFADYTITPQFVHDSTFQFAQETTGTTLVTIYEYTDNEVNQIFSREETYFREDFIETEYPSQFEGTDTLLQLPIEVGNSWTSEIGAEYEITDINVEVETPSGLYENTVEVTRTLDGYQTIRYYAEGVGLVQEDSGPDNEIEFSSSLTEIQEVPETIPLTLFPFNEDASGLVETPIEFTLDTNDPARIAINEILTGQHPDIDIDPLFVESVTINHMFLDTNNIPNIDFSEEIVTEMNFGSGGEAMFLQQLVNTFGLYYQADEVLITVDGEPYTSGHIILEEGETMEVNFDMVDGN